MKTVAAPHHKHTALSACNAARIHPCTWPSTNRNSRCKSHYIHQPSNFQARAAPQHAEPASVPNPPSTPSQAPEYPPGYGLTAQQQQQLETYLDYMYEINQVMNLTAVRDKNEGRQRHIMDSLTLLPVIDKHCKPMRVIDVGTGPGLPGIILAIARPEWEVTLMDSLKKRCDFMEAACKKCGISNTRVVWARAEDGGRDKAHREMYDLAVARAVAETRVLAELCLPYVKVGGWWVAAKGPNPQEEVGAAKKALQLLGGSLKEVALVDSFGPEGQRTAVVVSKNQRTEAKYPRQVGVPNKKPL